MRSTSVRDDASRSRGRDGRVRVRLLGRRTGLVAPLLGIGLLLWARLILVSDMPRMALAEPEDAAQSSHDHRARGADGKVVDAPAPANRAEPARSAASFPDPHDRHSFTPEAPKSERDPSE